jgi:Tfp pilus assembly protein PilP
VKPSAVAPEIKKPAANARDPFVSIIRNPDKTGGAPCVSGKKCLVIGEIVLRGIVKSPNAIIAVVENPQKKTYFLRENDPVFNGNVVKITTDSVVFREQIIDRAGHSSSRDITKQLNARPIA